MRKVTKWTDDSLNLCGFKGTMSPQAHARDDKKHFKIVGATFSESSGSCFFNCLNSVNLRNFLFTNVQDLVITDIFESLCNVGKAKIPRRVVCKLSQPDCTAHMPQLA